MDGVVAEAQETVRLIVAALFSRIGEVGRAEVLLRTGVAAGDWIRTAPWEVCEAGLRATRAGARVIVYLPGPLLDDNPEAFAVQSSGPGGDATVQVQGLGVSVQEQLPWD